MALGSELIRGGLGHRRDVLVEVGVCAASEPIQARLTDAAREVRDQVHDAELPSSGVQLQAYMAYIRSIRFIRHLSSAQLVASHNTQFGQASGPELTAA